MEVGVKVWVENYRSEENRHVSSAYLTFVAIDADGNRVPVPPVIPETEMKSAATMAPHAAARFAARNRARKQEVRS
jgi:acyl-CoA hydrolase